MHTDNLVRLVVLQPKGLAIQQECNALLGKWRKIDEFSSKPQQFMRVWMGGWGVGAGLSKIANH